MRTNAWSGAHEDDLRGFFGRSAWDVAASDLWRWRAACRAERELAGEIKG